jgi:hypothetical protein
MKRRDFLAAMVAGAAASGTGGVVSMEAVIGPSVPARVSLLIPPAMKDGFIELRTYTNPTREFVCSLERVAASADGSFLRMPADDTTFVLRFETLRERERFWNAVNADPEWPRLRREFESYRFAVYRPART